MPICKLTKRAVDGITAAETAQIWYDSELKGFGLKVTPAGVMTWIVEYRPGAGGRRAVKRRMTIGKAGALAPEEARNLAKDILVRVHAGEDPAETKAEARAAMTVQELCTLYLDEAEKGNIISKRGVSKKASTLASDRGRITRHVLPLLGKKRVPDVTRGDIEKFLRDVANGETATDVRTKKFGRAIVTGGKGTATRTVRMLGGIFSYAMRLGLRKDNPTHGVTKFADRQSERFLNGAELERLGAALRDAETIGLPWHTKPDAPGAKHLPKTDENRRSILSQYATGAIRLLLFTGCRVREILDLKWSHVDMELGMLILPDSKTGAKKVFLGTPAIGILATLPRVKGSQYVIVGDNLDKPRSDLKRPWAMVSRAAGLEGVRLHDLRHTYASQGASAGIGLSTVGRLLGHADVKTTNRYTHFDADPLHRAADMVGASLSAALAAREPTSEGVVVPFKSARKAPRS